MSKTDGKEDGLQAKLRELDMKYEEFVNRMEDWRTKQINEINDHVTRSRKELEKHHRQLRDHINEQLLTIKMKSKQIKQDPTEFCHKCDTPCHGVNDSIQCDVCTKWNHFKCIGLSQAESCSISRYKCFVCKNLSPNNRLSKNKKDKSKLRTLSISPIPKSPNKTLKKRRIKLSQSDDDDDSDCVIIEGPPKKRHKSNTRKRKIKVESTDDEDDGDLSFTVPTESETESGTEYETESDDESSYDSSQDIIKHKSKVVSSKQEDKTKLNTYYSNKRNSAKKAHERFKKFKKNRDGKIMIKLPINTECTEYTKNRVFVTSFGSIPCSSKKALAYCDGDYIYPIGFKAYRIHKSYKDPRKDTKYFMEIMDDKMNGPKYKIYAQDDPNNIMIHKSPTTPWQNIIDKITERAKELNCDGVRTSNGTSGKRYLGLRDYLIMGIIELMPNANKCKTYWKTQKKHNLPPKPFFKHLTENDIVIIR